MNHSFHTNYQTSFRIARKDEQTFFSVVHSIYEWVCSKERDASLKKGWKEFSFKGSWDRCSRTNASVQTSTCLDGDSGRAWAMEYTHTDRQLRGKRFWHTHVGIRDTGESLVVSARNAYSSNNEDLSPDAAPPSPSVPHFVRQLIKNFLAFSGRKEFRLIERPLVLDKVGSGLLLRDFVASPERRYPLIIFNGNAAAQLEEARSLATELAGKAQVVVLGSNSALGKELRECFPADYRISYGCMRVFFPFVNGPGRPERHRWFDVTSDYYGSQREGIVHGLLRNHNLVERDSVVTLGDIHRLIAKNRLERLKESSGGASEEEVHALYRGYIEEVERERNDAKQEAEHYAQQIDQLESDLRAAEWKGSALSSSFGSQSGSFGEIRSLLSKLPETLEDVVNVAKVIYADRLVFASEALESAQENSECELISDAWAILCHLATTLHELKFGKESPGDLGKLFQERSGYEYAPTEGKQTKNDKRLCRLRQITHEGKDYEIWAHIKKGNDGNKMIRIHFDFDEEIEKILVGYVGLHMDNASTRARK